MEKYITYKESELTGSLHRIEQNLKTIKFWLKLMEEQVQGERKNISLEDYKHILNSVLNIDKELLNFGVQVKNEGNEKELIAFASYVSCIGEQFWKGSVEDVVKEYLIPGYRRKNS